MLTWWFIIFFVLIFGTLANRNGKLAHTGDYTYICPNRIYYLLAVVVLVFFSGLRSTTGDGLTSIGDTRVYTGLFKIIVKNNILDFLKTTDFENDWGFYAFMTILKQIFKVNEQGLFFFCSSITIGCLFFGYYKLHINRTDLLLFLFVVLGHYVTSMNGVRQWLVSSLLFLTVPLIKNKRFLLYAIIVLIMSTMHKSALVFIPLYFVVTSSIVSDNLRGVTTNNS